MLYRSDSAHYMSESTKSDLNRSSTLKHTTRPLFILLFLVLMLASSLSIQPSTANKDVQMSDSGLNFSRFDSIIASAAECEEGDSDCTKKKLDEALKDSKLEPNADGFGEALEGAGPFNSCSAGDQDIKTLVKRVFSVGYMNCTPSATIDDDTGGYKSTLKANNWRNCGIPSGPKFNGQENNTVYWHNCDVPNLLTEMMQDISYAFFPQGINGVSVQPVKTNNGWFGYSFQTPGLGDNQGSVSQDGNANITALEAFGYNLKYSRYNGEWDYIKVMTSARALSNFGAMDSMKLGVQTFFNSVSGGVDNAVSGFMDNLKAGDIMSVITSPFRVVADAASGGSVAALNGIMDTSDAKVFATMSWYRPSFGSTMYNARQLSQDEISRHITNQMNKFLGTLNVPVAEPPEDLAAASYAKLSSITRPRPGKCVGEWTVVEKQIVNVPGKEKSRTSSGNVSEMPFAGSEEECEKFIEKASKSTGINWAIESTKVAVTKYENQFTLAEWEAQAGWESVAKRYQIYCTIERSTAPEGEDFEAQNAAVDTLLNCWDDDKVGHPAAMDRETKAEQSKLNDEFFKNSLTCMFASVEGCDKDKKVQKKLAELTSSFTSPMQRYVCVNNDGTIRKDGSGNYVKLVVKNGDKVEYNSACLINGEAPVRPAIQNGAYGNGLENPNSAVHDTRRDYFKISLSDLTKIDEALSSTGLVVSNFTTRLSNTLLNLSFSPILTTIGVSDIIVSFIDGFRESIFFPFSVIIVMISAASIFWKAGVQRDYAAQGKSLLIIVTVFFIGAVVLFNPAKTIQVVDEFPAHIESSITGLIFSDQVNAEDNLCKATTTASRVGGRDFMDNTIRFDPAASGRNMLCENWRAFAFTPYVYGQWGTHYDNLDLSKFRAEGSRANLTENGPDGNMVAPRVNLGVNNSENNWALYQLDQVTSGTITEDAGTSRRLPADMYRIVDLQAGYDYNGNGHADNARSEYLEAWSGDNPVQRTLVSLTGAAISVLGLVTVGVFAIAKIKVSIMGTILIMFLPIMLLIGLLSGRGTYKLKGYVFQVLSLMAQRIALSLLIAIMLRVIIEVSKLSTSFIQYAMFTTAICVAFLLNKKQIVGMLDKSIVKDSGGFGLDFNQYLPHRMRQRYENNRRATKAATTGFIGGFSVGGFRGGLTAAKGEIARASRRSNRRNAKEGFGALSTVLQAHEDGSDERRVRESSAVDTQLHSMAEKSANERLKDDPLYNDPNLSANEREAMRQSAISNEVERLRPKTRRERKMATKAAVGDRDRRSDDEILSQIHSATQSGDGEGISYSNGGESSKKFEEYLNKKNEASGMGQSLVDEFKDLTAMKNRYSTEKLEIDNKIKDVTRCKKEARNNNDAALVMSLNNELDSLKNDRAKLDSDYVQATIQAKERAAIERGKLKDATEKLAKELRGEK